MTTLITNPIEQTEKYIDCSDKYQFVSTKDIIATAERFGWKVTKQIIDRAYKHKGFQRHAIIMEKDGLAVNGEGKIQLVIRNSHNRHTAVRLFLGFFRIACLNQLYTNKVGNGLSIAIRHSSRANEQVEAFLNQFDAVARNFVAQVDSMKTRILTIEEKRAVATELLKLRFDEKVVTEELVNKALETKRASDLSDSLWVVVNKVQETLIRGNVSFFNPVTQKVTKVRELSSVSRSIDLNSKVMDYALSYA